MITLYTTPSFWGIPSISPACAKLETWLRMAKIPHKTDITANIATAPKGKIPFVEYQGKLVGDSTLIIEMFKEKEGIYLDSCLTSTERSISLAFRRMLKENTYYGGVYIRYFVEENWLVYKEVLAGMLGTEAPPEGWEPFLEELRENLRNQMYVQGMGRHSSEEIYQIITADLQALSDFLADKPFFMGDKPTTLDATAYGYIGNFIKPPFASPIVDYALKLENLCQHCDRMNQQFFSDTELSG
ncbi:glutathione S-transferase family protein [Microseira wollei]|uniref:Glutathione S-transferase, putative n=1 Tax=Microseira wollei NIES-4236 TaxID=2530354 RepID=A0AAV3X690_9CYAN|nr:glutathione S-transferase family protein [Microseira wollei]GET35864.1 glutathione S-transferase, putative [Microseira wollei NIES-4236]